MGITRRDFTAAIGAAAATASGRVWAQPGPSPGAVRLRKDAADLNAHSDDILAFKEAMRLMRQPGRGGLSWRRQVAIHAGDHGQHGSWLFLPWHRAQLWHFERIVIRLTGHKDFALPYLNWDLKHVPDYLFTALPYDAAAFGPRKNGPGVDMAAWAELEGGGFNDSYRSQGFSAFFGGDPELGRRPGTAESYGHNLVHNFLGGAMANIATAPNDPLFWMHHANVDRVWAGWTKPDFSQPRPDKTYPKTWRDAEVGGFVDETGALVKPIKNDKLIDPAALGYIYVPIEPPMMGAGLPSTARAEGPFDRQLALAPRSPTVAELELPDEVVAHLKGADFKALDSYVDVVLVGADPRARIRVSLGAPGAADRREALPAFTLKMGMAMAPFTYRIDVADLLRANLAPGAVLRAEVKPMPGYAEAAPAIASAPRRHQDVVQGRG